MERFTGLLGLALILIVCWLLSSNRKSVRPRLFLWGLGLQFLFAFLVLKTPFGRVFQAASVAVNALLEYAEEGSRFVFGPLGAKAGPFGVVFAFQVLPIVIFIASLFSILYYFGVMQVVIKGMAWLMQRVMGASGAESTNVAASIFMGQTEAPLTIRPFLPKLTESELFTVMTCGMAHVSGAVMAAYVKIAGVSIEHLLTAVIMTPPPRCCSPRFLFRRPGSRRPRAASTSKWRSLASTSSTPRPAAPAKVCNSPSTSPACSSHSWPSSPWSTAFSAGLTALPAGSPSRSRSFSASSSRPSLG